MICNPATSYQTPNLSAILASLFAGSALIPRQRRYSRLSITLAVRLRPAQSKEQDVYVTKNRQKKRMMNADPIGDPALRNRDNRSPHDRHNHHSGAVSR